jgi:hypothetical protein
MYSEGTLCSKDSTWLILPNSEAISFSERLFNIGEPSSVSANEYNILDVSQTAQDSNSERIVDLDILVDHRYELKKPFKVKIKRDESSFIGEITELDIYAFGDNEFEILREINRDVSELFEELSNLRDKQLGTRPKKWKNILSQYIQKSVD